jgi:hypothetical protein
MVKMRMPSIKFEPPTREVVVARCTTVKAWQLPKQASSIAPDTVWSNAGKLLIFMEK